MQKKRREHLKGASVFCDYDFAGGQNAKLLGVKSVFQTFNPYHAYFSPNKKMFSFLAGHFLNNNIGAVLRCTCIDLKDIRIRT